MKAIDPLTRFEIAPNGCWLWTGPLDRHGYGRHGGLLAHRVVYELLVGPVPEGLELDHLCRAHACVNPDHLEPVPHGVNCARGRAGEINAARQRSLTHCKRGHEFTPENTRIDGRGHRACRACSRELHRGYYHRDLPASREYVRRKARERYARGKAA